VSEALGGISRITFQMSVSTLPHRKLMHAIEILGTQVAPSLRKELTPALPAPDRATRTTLPADNELLAL